MTARLLLTCLALCALLTAGTATASAQTIRGTLTGRITDATGAVVPGVTVTVTNRNTAIETSAVSERDGTFTMPLLPPGSYDATVQQQGFKKYVREGITVQIAQT